MATSYPELLERAHLIADLASAASVLAWDQETYMPEGSVGARAEQLSTLSSLLHRYSTDASARALASDVASYQGDLPAEQQAIARTFARDVEKATMLPERLVREQARVASLAQDAWKKARSASDFSLFSPLLSTIVELKREEASLLGPTSHPYNNLLDAFEPGATVEMLDPVFDELQVGTQNVMKRVAAAKDVDNSIVFQHYPSQEQQTFATDVIQQLGFSLHTGRVDLSAHPFCTSFTSHDVRLTTRVRTNDIRSCLFGLIHEAGHGMYEQGIAAEFQRTPCGGGASMGIHESQSLFWENIIARSPEFWQWAYPKLQHVFPDVLRGVHQSAFVQAINKVEPSLNRVESDEVSYNLHIIVRYHIERDLIAGTLDVNDIPSRWNTEMEQLLGVVPANDAEGCLQDVHWSFGGIGYFPSYTLGKLYASMMYTAMQTDIPNVQELVSAGSFLPIKSWLQERVHRHGRSVTPHELITTIAGRGLTATDFMQHVTNKVNRVYHE
jgi:carboxypeptidase Taq